MGQGKENIMTKLPSMTKILTAFIVVILVLPILYIHPVFAAKIFDDGFETGDFSKWTVKSGGFVTSGDAHHGTYKAVLNVSGQYDQAKFTSVDHCFFRAYVMFKSFPANGTETTILGVYNTSSIYMSEARVANVNGTLKWKLRYYDNGAQYTAVSEQQKPVLNTWYCVEVEGKSNSTTAAESRIYIDGTELTDVSQTAKNNNYLINCAYIWMNGAVTLWYDCVVVDTAYIGPEADNVPPVFSAITANTTAAGKPCRFDCLVTDDVNVSTYIFSTNNTSAWINDTAVVFSSFYGSKAAWANVTKTLSDTVGNVVSYLWYANDTSNNWGKSDQYNLTLTVLPKLFEDGFESGNFSRWSATGGSPTVTSGDAHHGTYKAVLVSGQYAQKIFTSYYDRLSMRVYVLFKTFPNTTGASSPIFGVWNTSPARYMATVYIANVSGTLKWQLRYYNNGSYYTVTSGQQTNPSLDTWYCVEVEGVSNSTTNAEARVYVNGSELTDITQTGKNNTAQMNSGYLQVSGSPTSIWYDCVAIDTAYIGPECTLTVNVAGSGSVAKVPDQTFYSWGTNITLTANPSIFWSFDHWSGDASGAVNPITINMTSNKTITATFTRGPATIHVPGDYLTISAAIAAANAGDTILVDPGTYNEEVVINKAVEVIGSGAGSTFIDGTGVALDSPGLVKITAAGDVTFSGFTVRNAPAGPVDIFDILTQSSVAGVTYTISHNKIYGTNDPDNANDWGFYSSNDQANLVFTDNMVTQTGCNNIVLELHTGATEISHNTLDAGVWGTDAIYVMTYNGYDVTALQNISYNTFNMGTGGPFDNDHHASAISFDTPGAAWGLTDAKFTNVVIEGNTISNLESYRRGIGFWNGGGGGGGAIAPLVKSNSITGVVGATESYGIDFIGASATTNAAILNNGIYNCSYGVYLRTTDCAPGAQIHFNEISGNAVGLDNTVGSSDVDARYNYWGAPSGPYNAVSNPSGLGNPVTANVNYKPYLNAPWPECSLTVNVVGSGSVAKDPDQTVYDWGTNVTLTANPTIGWSFDHWSGDASGTDNSITINMTSDKTVTATFGAPDLTVSSITVFDLGCSIYKNDTDALGNPYYYPVEVHIANTGDFDASAFYVKLEVYWINGSMTEISEEIPVSSLTQGTATTVNFFSLFNPMQTGYHRLTATVDSRNEVVESNETNNALVQDNIRVTIIGDLNNDGVVNIFDGVQLSLAWYATPSDAWWNIKADLNHNGVVNILDATRASIHWGETV
jgi:hypothetical protein